MATYWELRYAQGDTCPNAEEHRDAQSADVFLQISSLVSLRFLSQVEPALLFSPFFSLPDLEESQRESRDIIVMARPNPI